MRSYQGSWGTPLLLFAVAKSQRIGSSISVLLTRESSSCKLRCLHQFLRGISVENVCRDYSLSICHRPQPFSFPLPLFPSFLFAVGHCPLLTNTSPMISKMNKIAVTKSAIFQKLYGRSPCISPVRPLMTI